MSVEIPLELIKAACPSLGFATTIYVQDVDDLPLTKALGQGERWITVHPPGHDVGTPVLIQEHPDGTATVIGGAGGSMNHLKLRGIKPAESYRGDLAKKAQERRAARKEMVKQEKADGTHQAKQAVRADLREQVEKGRKDFIAEVASAAGWTKKDLEFDEKAHAELSGPALAKARKDHEANLFQKAKKLVDINRRYLAADSDARAASGLGEVPLRSEDASTLSVDDLSPMPETAPGLRFAPAYKERAQKQGMTEEDHDFELSKVKPQPPEKQAQAAAKRAKSQSIKEEMELFSKKNPDTATLDPKVLKDAKQAAQMVRSLKKLRLLEKAARAQSEQIDAGVVHESKAAVLEVTDEQVEKAAAEQMENDVATEGTRAFLLEAERLGGEAGVGANLSTGAYNALNAVSTTLGGAPIIDRSVVDVLGVEASAAIVARRLASSLKGEDLENARLAMADYHREDYLKRQESTRKEAEEMLSACDAINVPESGDGFELSEGQEINAKRRDAVNNARRVVGQAMGEMRANAAVTLALGSTPKDSIDISLGKQSASSAVTQLYAIGLKQGTSIWRRRAMIWSSPSTAKAWSA